MSALVPAIDATIGRFQVLTVNGTSVTGGGSGGDPDVSDSLSDVSSALASVSSDTNSLYAQLSRVDEDGGSSISYWALDKIMTSNGFDILAWNDPPTTLSDQIRATTTSLSSALSNVSTSLVTATSVLEMSLAYARQEFNEQFHVYDPAKANVGLAARMSNYLMYLSQKLAESGMDLYVWKAREYSMNTTTGVLSTSDLAAANIDATNFSDALLEYVSDASLVIDMTPYGGFVNLTGLS